MSLKGNKKGSSLLLRWLARLPAFFRRGMAFKPVLIPGIPGLRKLV